MSLMHLTNHSTQAAALLKAMANERRLTILAILSEGERSVRELEGMVQLSQSALSQHLARLRRDHLVQTRRSAQTIFYSLRGDAAKQVMECLANLYHSSDDTVVPFREAAE